MRIYNRILININKEENIMSTREIRIGAKYRHFKGNEYLVLHVAKHSETLEEYVVYQALYGERGIWVRPLEMFLSVKEVEGKQVYRFEEML
jgi:hypothetical protein